MPLAEGIYTYTITATRADGVTNTATGTVNVGLGVVAGLGSINNSQTLGPVTTAVAEPPFSVASSPSGTVNSGDLVSIQLVSGDGSETLSCSAGSIGIFANDGTTLQFFAPDPPTFGDQTLTFNSAIEFTVTQGGETATFDMPIEPASGELFGQIASIHPDGIYADDTVAIGDYAHIRNITAGLTVDVSTGRPMVSQASSLEYALYDGTWSAYGTETFPAPTFEETIGQALETETAGSIVAASGLSAVIGNAIDTETASPISAETDLSLQLGSATETDQAGSINPQVVGIDTVALGNASEGETANAINARAPITVALGRAIETEQAGWMISGAVASLGTANEAETANPITAIHPQTVMLGNASETDTANSFGFTTINLAFVEPDTVIEIEISEHLIECEVA